MAHPLERYHAPGGAAVSSERHELVKDVEALAAALRSEHLATARVLDLLSERELERLRAALLRDYKESTF